MRLVMTAGLLAGIAGCGGAGSINAPALPSYDPDAISRAAVQQLDKNGNGTVEDSELDACPGLKAILGEVDADGDKKLTADELRGRFARYSSGAAGGGLVSVTCVVTLNDTPLAGAAVRFEPEPFMGTAIKPAVGTTGEQGRATMQVEGETGFGVFPGVYKIKVTGPGGKELPARYNAKTTLGREVFEGARGSSGSVDLRLRSN